MRQLFRAVTGRALAAKQMTASGGESGIIPVRAEINHISGFERSQLLLLPEAIDDYVVANGQGDTTRSASLRIYNKMDCKHGGWETFPYAPPGPFQNQGRCVNYFDSLLDLAAAP